MDEPTETPAPQKQKPKLSREQLRRRGKRNLVIAAAVVIIVIIEIATMGGHKSQFSATTAGYAVIDPATVSVSFHVTNNGSSSADPTCTITAQDPGGTYYGTDQFQLQGSIAPGQTTTSADSITITKQGAQYVTQTSIKCQ